MRTRIEQDAFARMTPAWKRLGFAFDRLVPSYATAIGSSSDKPLALAELMGIILDDGMRQSTLLVPSSRMMPPCRKPLPAVDPPILTHCPVSPRTTRTRSHGTSISSATNCATEVSSMFCDCAERDG